MRLVLDQQTGPKRFAATNPLGGMRHQLGTHLIGLDYRLGVNLGVYPYG